MPENITHEKLINETIKKIGNVKSALILSAEGARRNKKKARKISAIAGALIAVVGLTLARVSAFDTAIPGTGIPIREALSYLSALLGATVTFVNERFDPAKLREREVALGDLIHKFGLLQEDAMLNLVNSEAMNAETIKNLLDDLRNKEDALLEEAEEWKAGVRAIRESEDAA
jgi:hypothetical protein